MGVIDRPTAARLGITPDLIDQTLGNAFASRWSPTIIRTHQYAWVMEATALCAGPEALKEVTSRAPRAR